MADAMVGLAGLVAAAIVTCRESTARASCAIEHPLTGLGTRLGRLGEPPSLALAAGAVAAPLVLAPTGADFGARTFYFRHLGAHYDAERISVTAPYALAAALGVGWSAAALEGDCASSRVANRALQAVGVAAAVAGVAKLAVGRTYPATDPAHDLVDDGRAWRAAPFSMVGAWPSGHAATTFAFAAAIRTSLPHRAGVFRYVGYVLAAAVSAGMLLGDHHWTSDVLSGALLGEAIGRSFGGGSGEGPSVVAGGACLALGGGF
jgi:membrane-associated phospholipid phosphatase